MSSFALNNITAPDQYQAMSSLYPLPLLDHINIDVANSTIYWSIAQTSALSTDRSGDWQPEVFMSPGSRSLVRRNCVGVRIRAAVPAASLPLGGVQAQVTVEAVELDGNYGPGQPQSEALVTLSGFRISSGGNVNPGGP